MNVIKKLATKSHLIEWLLITFVVFTFDFIFIMKYGFSITLEHYIIAFFNVMLVLSILAFIKNNKWRYFAYMFFILIMFTFFVTDSTLYRFKSDVTSIAMLLESGKNTMKIGLKYNPLEAYNVFVWLIIIAFVTAAAIILRKVVKLFPENKPRHAVSRTIYLIISVLGLMFAPNIIDQADRILFNTPSDKALFVQKFGSITYHAKDIATYTTNALKPLIYADDYADEINEDVTSNFASQTDLFGMFSGKNVIMIMCETCEEYAFTPEYTPNYYRLKDMGIYFNNFYSAAKSNYTYDAEFKSLTSMMYMQGDNFMYTYGDNAYPTSLPSMLKNNGYSVNSFHNYYADFFNRDEMHVSLGFERFYAVEDLVVEENDFWPLDSVMFDQFRDVIAPIQDVPFFSFIITVTPHGPHDKYRSELDAYYQILDQDPNYIDESMEYRTITAAQMNFDEGLGILLDDLETKDLLNDTIILLFSDHKNYSSQDVTLEKTPNSEIPYEIEKVPFVFYVPGFTPGENPTLSSHYDLTPTLLDLLGIPYYQDFYYGQSLFVDAREDRPIILSYSSWISITHMVMFDEVVYGDIDVDTYDQLKTDVYETIQFFEMIFFSDYFRQENPYYYVEPLSIADETELFE
ncbi:MAG: LTA synthase family protein [Acholeplasma sp.]|jgi:phosphoglycerol transferase MdoB-like AlkP superfamily enzyme|nr:MAG: LTA synthase family protein [Acholeplasma sp.]